MIPRAYPNDLSLPVQTRPNPALDPSGFYGTPPLFPPKMQNYQTNLDSSNSLKNESVTPGFIYHILGAWRKNLQTPADQPIPNGQLANLSLESLSAKDKFWFNPSIRLRYDTTAAQMQSILKGLDSLLTHSPWIKPTTNHVRFTQFGTSSLKLEGLRLCHDKGPARIDYFYGFNSGDTSQFEPVLFENHNRVPRSTDPNYHISHDLADHAISWMQRVKEIDPDRPFLLYVAPSATHSPHMAPREWIDKFKGQFDMGWDRYSRPP